MSDTSATHGGVRGWLHELPYIVMLLLTLGGVGYSVMTRSPLRYYWELVAIFNCAACIYEGWRHMPGKGEQWRLIWTQLLHWAAFLAAMGLLFLPSVQAIADTNATGLAILLLLALGTFVAGVHTVSWRVGLNGVVLAVCVPLVAWIDQSALFLFGALAVLAFCAIGILLAVRGAGVIRVRAPNCAPSAMGTTEIRNGVACPLTACPPSGPCPRTSAASPPSRSASITRAMMA